jgi:hypothetical protein
MSCERPAAAAAAAGAACVGNERVANQEQVRPYHQVQWIKAEQCFPRLKKQRGSFSPLGSLLVTSMRAKVR